MAACKRVIQLGAKLGIDFSKSHAFVDSRRPRLEYRHVSQLVKSHAKHAFLVDTLALVRGMEAQGVPSKQAEAITAAITEVLHDSLENISHSFVSKSEMQKIELIQESNLSKFKYEGQSSQEHHFSMLQRETEKLRTDIEKMGNELRYEIGKVTAGQRLEFHALRAHLEAAKYDVIKYCIGTLVSISVVGLAVLRILV